MRAHWIRSIGTPPAGWRRTVTNRTSCWRRHDQTQFDCRSDLTDREPNVMIAGEFAPILLFAYARPEHTERTLAALEENALAGESDLYVFADAPREGDRESAERVAEIVSRPWKF